MINSLTNYNFILKLRSITGVFDATKIKHGLQAMEYSIQTLALNEGTIFISKGLSTRGIHLSIKENGLDLTLFPFSCDDDWELLRDWLLVFFTFHSAIVIAENDLIEDIEKFFDAEKLKSQRLIYENLLHHYMHSEETLHFFSVNREFYAGVKIFERIREQPEEEQLSYFYAIICKSQYTTLNAENGKVEKIREHLSSTYSLLNNQGNIVLQPADMLKIQENPKDEFFISYSSMDKLLRHGWIYLDEKQIYIPEMPVDEWKLFCTQAKLMSINTELFSKYVEGNEEE
ncbi:MAG: hypothetical protein NTW54_12815 [Bacteroidetes bacterium]|nr:hypothetical protein [Bacteroidota bacterium]